MLVLLSPSKTQNFESPAGVKLHTEPQLLAQSKRLIEELRKMTVKDIGKLMQISEKLSTLNHDRYKAFKTPFTISNAKQAIFAFEGDVYDGFDVATLDHKAIEFAQSHLRILSGLYGVLRPLDLIQAYRLEMKIKLKNKAGNDLYHFWGDSISEILNEDVKHTDSKILINLASEEYFKAVRPQKIKATIVTPQFKEKKGNNFKMIAFFAKKARGSMARYIMKNQIDTPEALHFFAEDGYRFNVTLSRPNSPVYTRG